MIREELADGISLYCGDCLDVLKAMESNSIDSVVTDPPYGLGKEPDAFEMLKDWIDAGHYEAKSKSGFMGREWDRFVPQPQLWKEVYRVLKPGGHVVSFFGTRTYDLGVLAIRLAGFEVRDQIAWLTGQGFPKSRNVSKDIDKHFGAERKVVGTARGKGGENLNQLARANGNDASDAKGCGAFGAGAKQIDIDIPVTAPATPEAAKWEGFGTALKPALEPIVLARKPLSESTVAANVLKWGTGALNIDGCRIATDWKSERGDGWLKSGVGKGNPWHGGEYIENRTVADRVSPLGRWPANVCHDGSEEVVSLFPYTKSGAMKRTVEAYDGDNVTGFLRGRSGPQNQRADEGSAARFFYCSKATRADRAGSRHPTVKPINLMQWLTRLVTPPNGIVLDPFAGTGTTAAACHREGFQCIMIEREEEYQDDIRRRVESFGRTPEVESPSIVPQDQQATLF